MDTKQILNTKLSEIKLSDEEEAKIMAFVKNFSSKLNKRLSKYKAKCFIGGSFSKGTAIRKKAYDVDIFAIFPKKSKDISELLEKSLKGIKVKYARIPGSRDYFNVKAKSGLSFSIEIVPVIDIKNSKAALNITDVSPLHVKYINKKIAKNKKLRDDIRLVKAFCYAQDCYGAESYIKGFSGYCIEVLTTTYGSFTKLIREASKWSGKDKVIIDPEKFYPKKNDILDELNEAKLFSPLILIDPVQKTRNVAAALSREKFEKFSKVCKAFISKPTMKFFEKKEISEKEIINEAKKKKNELFRVHAFSDKVKEDISGAKLLKLNNLMVIHLEKEGYKFKHLWLFEGKDSDSYFTLTKKPGKIVQNGPPLKMESYAAAFKKKWKNWKVKNGKLFMERKPKGIKDVLNVNKRTLREMGIGAFKIKKLN